MTSSVHKQLHSFSAVGIGFPVGQEFLPALLYIHHWSLGMPSVDLQSWYGHTAGTCAGQPMHAARSKSRVTSSTRWVPPSIRSMLRRTCKQVIACPPPAHEHEYKRDLQRRRRYITCITSTMRLEQRWTLSPVLYILPFRELVLVCPSTHMYTCTMNRPTCLTESPFLMKPWMLANCTKGFLTTLKVASRNHLFVPLRCCSMVSVAKTKCRAPSSSMQSLVKLGSNQSAKWKCHSSSRGSRGRKAWRWRFTDRWTSAAWSNSQTATGVMVRMNCVFDNCTWKIYNRASAKDNLHQHCHILRSGGSRISG